MANGAQNSSFPATDFYAVTPADADLAVVTRALYIGGLGDVVVQGLNGINTTFTAVPAGTILPVRARQVRAATSATAIVALV